jgi:Ubiquitin carboxyl-terminal hydrolase
VVEATFQVRTTCAGNCEASRTRREQLDQTRLWTVNIDHSKGAVGGTLQDAIRTTMTNEIDLTCRKCKNLGKEGKLGRIWHRLRDAPEILFIRIARFERTKRGRLHKKCNNEVFVPEILDLTPYLEESDKQTGVEAKYRLCGAISHAGTISSGHFVSHVRAQNRQWYRLDDEVVTDSSIPTLNNDAAKFGRHKFTPYVLAYTKIFDGDVSVDPPPPQPTPPPTLATRSSTDVKFRVKVDVAGQQSFTMTRKLKGLSAPLLESQHIGLQMEIIDADGNTMLRVEPITFQLARAASESSGSGRGGGERSPRTSRKARAGVKGLATPSPTPKKTTTTSKTARSKGEERAKVGKVKAGA